MRFIPHTHHIWVHTTVRHRPDGSGVSSHDNTMFLKFSNHTFISHDKPHTDPFIHNSRIMPKIYFCTPLYTCPPSHNHTQSKQVTRESSNVQNITHPRPTPRPGWGVSLRRDVSLRRASPRLGERTKTRGVAITGSRLSEIPLAWASGQLAQKVSESPGRDFVQKISLFHLA